MTKILVDRGTIISMGKNGTIHEGAIIIENDKIIDIRSRELIRKNYSWDIVIDAYKKVVLPGFINAHTHTPYTILRGLSEDLSLEKWLQHLSGLKSMLIEEDFLLSIKLACLEMIKSGITCFVDSMLWPKGHSYTDSMLKVIDESGIRCIIANEVSDEIDDSEECINRSISMIKRWHRKGNILCMLAPHSTYKCSPQFLKQIRKLANLYRVIITIHLAETAHEVKDIKEKFGKSPIELAYECELLGPDLLAAHCVWLSKEDIKLLKEFDVKVAHNPVSNMKLGSGIAPILKLLNEGIVVALGTDSVVSNNRIDIIQEMKVAALLQKVVNLDASVPKAKELLKMATINGAKALGLEKEIGSLEVGKKADIVVINMMKPYTMPSYDPITCLVYSSTVCDIETVIVNGKLLMENRRVKTMNEFEILENTVKISTTLAKKLNLKV
ncbi:MAG: amidohydrolase [Candidatus Bathyarchaeia archaeon]